MKHLYKAFCGALLVLGLAGIIDPAVARGYHWDRPAIAGARTQHRRVCARAPRVVTRKQSSTTPASCGRTRLIQENRVIVHVRPVINREVVVHRTNTIVKDVFAASGQHHQRVRNEYFHETVNRRVGHGCSTWPAIATEAAIAAIAAGC